MSKVRQWVLCRTGTFGQDGATITEKDIDELVETFPGRRPPIAIGHNMAYDDKMPQFGAVLDVWKKKTRGAVQLIGDVKLIEAMDPVFDQGAYQGWSVSIPREAATGKRYLHHLALCGSVPPKIPGLKEIGISYGDKEEKEIFSFTDKIEFQEDSMTDEDKKKMEELEKKNKDLQEENEALKKKPADKKDNDFSELEKKYDALEKKYEAREAETRKSRVASFMKAVAEKVPAGVKAKVQALADQLVGIPEFSFSDEEGKEAKGDALNLFEDVLMAVPAPVETGRSNNNYSDQNKGNGGDKGCDMSKIANKF